MELSPSYNSKSSLASSNSDLFLYSYLELSRGFDIRAEMLWFARL